jgi:V/A-type H+-transporting ATPase subunit E
MDAKIRELTDKIYREGVEKGNEQAEAIVAAAQTKSDEMLAAARAEAERIVQEAKRKADETRKNTESELKLYTGQMMQSLRSSITDTISGEIATQNISAAITDPNFMRQAILKMVSNWTPGEAVVIETSDAKELEQYFIANAKNLMDEGKVTIKEVNGKPSQFVLSPLQGTYKVTFGEDELVAFFKEFLRPGLVTALF